jgi:Major Facilitator Superfamily
MPASRAEVSVVYGAGVVQGIALVTFPAAGTIFTSPDHYGLTSTQYGTMFIPQVVTAIGASLLGGAAARRFTLKRVYLAGLGADLVSMSLLLISQFTTGTKPLAYGLLLVATGYLGVGFGLVVPALNTFAADFHPDGVDRAVLALNALLGLGTALAPVFVAIFIGLGAWWGLPILTLVLLGALLLVSLGLPLRVTTPDAASAPGPRRRGIPGRFWLFAGFAVLYGISETMNGNWSEPYMSHLGATTTTASLALTVFWVMVTFGRVVFAQFEHIFPTPWTYHVLPFVLAAAFVGIAVLPHGSTAGAIVLFGVAGLGCSALLPLTISFSQEQLVSMSAVVASGVIAFYQAGYGIAAFGAGPLQSAGVSLSTIYGFTAVVAVAMGVLSFVLARPHHRVHHIHPRPPTHLQVGRA